MSEASSYDTRPCERLLYRSNKERFEQHLSLSHLERLFALLTDERHP